MCIHMRDRILTSRTRDHIAYCYRLELHQQQIGVYEQTWCTIQEVFQHNVSDTLATDLTEDLFVYALYNL